MITYSGITSPDLPGGEQKVEANDLVQFEGEGQSREDPPS